MGNFVEAVDACVHYRFHASVGDGVRAKACNGGFMELQLFLRYWISDDLPWGGETIED